MLFYLGTTFFGRSECQPVQQAEELAVFISVGFEISLKFYTKLFYQDTKDLSLQILCYHGEGHMSNNSVDKG